MKLISLITLLIICVAINIATLVWINIHPILALIIIIVEAWVVASIIKTEPKQNNKGKIQF